MGVSGPDGFVLLLARRFPTRRSEYATFRQYGAYLRSYRYCWIRPYCLPSRMPPILNNAEQRLWRRPSHPPPRPSLVSSTYVLGSPATWWRQSRRRQSRFKPHLPHTIWSRRLIPLDHLFPSGRPWLDSFRTLLLSTPILFLLRECTRNKRAPLPKVNVTFSRSKVAFILICTTTPLVCRRWSCFISM